MTAAADSRPMLPREKWFWLGLALLLLLAGWLYLRGYNVSLPFIEHHDEAMHMIAGQHLVDFGHGAGVHDAYPPGTKTLAFLFLKHLSPADAHHSAMLPALRLVSISAWAFVIVLISLLGALTLHPLTGLMAAAIWIVNPWVVDRAHFFLPDGFLTMFTLLALWLALIGALHGRRSYSTAAVYSIMLAIVFKTQALFVAPLALLLPLVNWRRQPEARRDTLRQTFWNMVRFAVFLFWLLLIYPTLEADEIVFFAMSYSDLSWPQLDAARTTMHNLLQTFWSLDSWLLMALASLLLWRCRRRLNPLALAIVVLAGLAWLLGMSMYNVRNLRHFFAVGALLSLLYAIGLSGLHLTLDEALKRLPRDRHPWIARLAPACLMLVLLAVGLLPAYRESDALARHFTLHDRRNDLMAYADASLPPGKIISERATPISIHERWARFLIDREWGNHKTFNRAWGGYTGLHDFPMAQDLTGMLQQPLEVWREQGAVYAIVPHAPLLADPEIYFPEETVRLKTYPVSREFRGPDMVVLRLYPMQYESAGQLGSIQLLGYDLNATELPAGGELVFRHYWRADSPTDAVYHVFNHILDDAGAIATQFDFIPLFDARRPTSSWDDPDEILFGREFRLRLPADLPAGDYALVSGFYNPATGSRLVSSKGDDSVLLSRIRLLPAAP